MVITEWKLEKAKEVWQREAEERGEARGQNRVLELMEQGYTPTEIKAKLAQTEDK
ncbi:hypothetical protein AGMMS49944_17120 [Spirochaetia bacterium]|nr:hypothetical protein AGMMS49944_17120 [Spirochaetia bacterium]